MDDTAQAMPSNKAVASVVARHHNGDELGKEIAQDRGVAVVPSAVARAASVCSAPLQGHASPRNRSPTM